MEIYLRKHFGEELSDGSAKNPWLSESTSGKFFIGDDCTRAKKVAATRWTNQVKALLLPLLLPVCLIREAMFQMIIQVSFSLRYHKRKLVQFQLAAIIFALILNITSACLTGIVMLTAVKLCWVNMIMVIVRAVQLSNENPYELASEPPYKDSVKSVHLLEGHQNFFINMMWRTYIVELILNITSACLIGSVPLIADELFWENMIMVILRELAPALASEPPYKDSVKHPPVGRTFSNILGPSSYHFTDFWFQAKGASILWLSLVVLNTLISYTFVFCQAMARSLPLDKHKQVKHLRITFDEVIAVTGFGTNDARALHEADVGLAMGIARTEGIVNVWTNAWCKGVTRNFSLRDLMHYHTINTIEAGTIFLAC